MRFCFQFELGGTGTPGEARQAKVLERGQSVERSDLGTWDQAATALDRVKAPLPTTEDRAGLMQELVQEW